MNQFYTHTNIFLVLCPLLFPARFGNAGHVICSLLRYDLSSLRILGTVGEPINPEAWRWFYEVVGQSRCPVVDTFWQTETVGDDKSTQIRFKNIFTGFLFTLLLFPCREVMF